MTRRSTITVLCALTIGLVLVARVLWQSHGAYEDGLSAEKKGQIVLAVTHYRRAIQWYLPLNPFVGRSVSRLFALGQRLEAEQRLDQALLAYRGLRAGLYSVRHVASPFAEQIGRCDTRIAALMTQQKLRSNPKVDAKQVQARYLRQLKIDHAPNAIWSLVMVLAFIGWAALGFVLIWRGFDAAGRLEPRRAWPLASGLLGCLVLWFVGLRLA